VLRRQISRDDASRPMDAENRLESQFAGPGSGNLIV
jgi:hypothetical protein